MGRQKARPDPLVLKPGEAGMGRQKARPDPLVWQKARPDPLGLDQRFVNTRSQTPWPSLMPRFSNLVSGRQSGRGA